MDTWTIFAAALVAMIVALFLAFLLKSRLSDDDVWEELVDPNAPPEGSEAHESSLPAGVYATIRAEEFPVEGVQPMPSSNSAKSPGSSDGAELRRSSRVEDPVPLIVLGTNRQGESFQERTSAVAFNLHGCRYSSRHDYPLEGWVTLQVTGTEGAAAPGVRARVRSIVSPQSGRELCQVGVELETPANIWGLPTPPEDWQRLLGSLASSARTSTARAPLLDPSAPPASFLPRPLAPVAVDRRAEVAIFPSPSASSAVAPPPAPETAAAGESVAAKPERLTLTPEQLLQALQGRLQLAADRAVESAIAARLDESVSQALTKIDDVWKANVRQTEEFSAARLAEVQSRWERELVVYRSRAEEISKRMEGLASSTRQGLIDLQKFADRLKTEIEPQLTTRLNESFARAGAEFEAKSSQLTERRLAQLADFSQHAALQARSQLDATLAEARALLATPHPSASDDRLEALVNSSREFALNRMEERLADVWTQFEQQQDPLRRRVEEIAEGLETRSKEWQEGKSQNEQAHLEIRSHLAGAPAVGAPDQLAPLLNSLKEQLHNDFEWRLGEVSGHFQQLHDSASQRAQDLAQQLVTLAGMTRGAHAEHEQSLGEIRSFLGSRNPVISQEQLDGVIVSLREQLFNHLEGRLGEISGQLQQQQETALRHDDELSERFAALRADTLGRIAENRAMAENLVQNFRLPDTPVDQSVDRAAREFETSAARISDRHLIRLMQQKQALAAEATLELEARATETRALLQKAANSTLEEFRQRVEAQLDLVIAEATERVSSTLTSLDAESRAACETRRREVETQVAQAAEQSTLEFRSGIKAFLYSCLVAAVSAVDEHAQTTLGHLSKEPSSTPPTLNAPGGSAPSPENRSSAASASGSTKDPRPS
jgi:hypothetical protein